MGKAEMIQQQLNKKSSVLKVPGMNIQVRSTWEILVLEVADVWEKGCLMEKKCPDKNLV